jgi:hypothetical protein
VRALETLHTALRPAGLLLDVRPAPQFPQVEVWHRDARGLSAGAAVVRLGQVEDPCIETLPAVDAALQTVIDAGRFVRERMEVFPFVNHCDSIDNWLAYMDVHWVDARISAEVVAHTREELSREAGELRVVEAIQAARLRRL